MIGAIRMKPAPRRYAIIFVCHAGPLEAKAAVLAVSLRRFIRLDCELIAAIPPSNPPSASARELLAELGIRTVSIANDIDPDYPVANKISCLSIQTQADKIIFLDSDMILMRPWQDSPRFAIAFNARPAATPSFTEKQSDWDAVYAACGARPLSGVIRTTYTEQMIAPYFNSAFVAVPANIGFGDVWLDCCRKIDTITDLPNKRPHLDQIALSPAVSRLGLAYDCLDERYNFAINRKPMDASDLPLFCHYHDARALAAEPAGVALVRELMQQTSRLREILSADPEWSPIIGSRGLDLSRGGKDLIVTGIPRSGTSYLCKLLHGFENCVVLIEPDEMVPAIASDVSRPPWSAARFYRDTRCRIILGEPIANKMSEGRLTEDTARGGAQTPYRPDITRGDFVLGMKWPIPFLSRLPYLRRVMPGAKIVACVRNPFDTIASWKKNFPRLRDADVANRPVGHPKDLCLTGAQRAELEWIDSVTEPAVRRAAWWRYMANLVLDSASFLTLVRYEQFVADPRPMLAEILDGTSAGRRMEAIELSRPRVSREELDTADIQAIGAICADAAARLGVLEEI